MSEGGELFPDGEAYERLMGRWSRLAGEAFLDWLDVPKGLRWPGHDRFSESATAAANIDL